MKKFKDVSGGIRWFRNELDGRIAYCGSCEWGEDILPEECPGCGEKINWNFTISGTSPKLYIGVCENSHLMRLFRWQ